MHLCSAWTYLSLRHFPYISHRMVFVASAEIVLFFASQKMISYVQKMMYPAFFKLIIICIMIVVLNSVKFKNIDKRFNVYIKHIYTILGHLLLVKQYLTSYIDFISIAIGYSCCRYEVGIVSMCTQNFNVLNHDLCLVSLEACCIIWCVQIRQCAICIISRGRNSIVTRWANHCFNTKLFNKTI